MSSTLPPQIVERSPVSEDYPLSAVPWSARKSILSMAFMLLGFTLYSGTFFAGGLVGPAFRFWDLVGLIVVGNLILGSYAATLGYIAAKSGLSTVLMARFSFGSIGSRWVDFILGFTQIGWYAWGSGLIADLLNKLAGVPTSWNWLIILFFTYFFCTTAYIGYRAMDWYSRLAVPAIIILMCWSLAIALNKVGGLTGLETVVPSQQMGTSEALTIIVGTFISGGTQATNWSRFANSGRTAIIATLAAFFVAGTHAFRSHRRTAFVLGGATIALALTWGGIYTSEQFINFLILLGTFIPPIGGVIMADYWLHYKGYFPSLTEPQPRFNWVGIITYVLAAAIAYFSPGIKPINGIIAAIALYFMFNKLISQTAASKLNS